MERGYEVYEYSRRGDVAELRTVLQSGVGPDEYMAYDGSTALVMAARTGFGDVVRELIAHKADVQLRTEDGSTMLHHAVSGGCCDVVRAVLDAGVGVNIANEDGVSPLILAAHYGKLDVVRLLCDHGADVRATADGWGTALDAANGEVADFLSARGAVRTEGGPDQPAAVAAERFGYGCFDTGANPYAEPIKAPSGPTAVAAAPPRDLRRPAVGDSVSLRGGKVGLLKPGDVGVIVEDDGSDCVPLKVKHGDAYDYYNVNDVVICEAAAELPPDSDRATADGTRRFLGKLEATSVSKLGSTGLCVSPVGFGCHRLEDSERHRAALELAVQMGCNLIDLAPNYTDGVAEQVAGQVLHGLISSQKVRRDELVIASKVGNVLGKQMAFASDVPGMTKVNDKLFHCISPEWIEQELTRSLERLQVSCLDCLLLHCPEYESKAEGVDMPEVYRRLRRAFVHLETEVSRGRVAMYGISGAFLPLRPTDPEHLCLDEVLKQLPENHHFRVLQFPLNFAEADALWVGHTERNADGSAVDKERILSAPTLFETARKNGLATLINRPLDGIYKESHGVLRFSSLDCDVRSFSELQLDNCDVMEEKLTNLCGLQRPPFNAGEGASGQLAAKTIKVLASLADVDVVLLGMRQPEYVLGTLPLLFTTPPVLPERALAAVRALNSTVVMWFATAIHEADHGTSKNWRLPVDQKYQEPVMVA